MAIHKVTVKYRGKGEVEWAGSMYLQLLSVFPLLLPLLLVLIFHCYRQHYLTSARMN